MTRASRRAGRPAIGSRDTRADILRAARTLFADVGFERTTMRAVATDAGVDVALIYHHFGSKDDLLAAALSVPEGARQAGRPIPAGTAEPGKALVHAVLELWENDPVLRQQALAMVRTGLSNDDAARRLRDLHTSYVLTLVADVAAEDDRELRAALIGAQLSGLLLTRYLLQVPALTGAGFDVLVDAVAPAIDHYLTGDVTGDPSLLTRRSDDVAATEAGERDS